MIYIFCHVLIVNSRCYGRCYVKKFYYCVLSLNFTLKFSKIVLTCFLQVFKDLTSYIFFKNYIFLERRHFSAYRATLKRS